MESLRNSGEKLIEKNYESIRKLEGIKPRIENCHLKTNITKTAATSFGFVATAFIGGALFAPVTAGASLILALGITGAVATGGGGVASLSAGVYNYIKTKKFQKLIHVCFNQRNAILEQFSEQFNNFYYIISETEEFQKIVADDNGCFGDDEESNRNRVLELLLKFKGMFSKHTKIVIGLNAGIDAVSTGKQIVELATSGGDIIRKTFIIVIRSKANTVVIKETALKTIAASANTVGHVLFGLGVALNFVDLGFLIHGWRNQHSLMQKINEKIKELENEILYYQKLLKVIENIEIVN